MKKQLRYLSAALMFAGAMQTGFAMDVEKPTWKSVQSMHENVEKFLPAIKDEVSKMRIGQSQKETEILSRLAKKVGVSADNLLLFKDIRDEETFNSIFRSKSHDDSSSILDKDKSPLLNLGKKNLLSVDDAEEKLAQAILRIQELEKENQRLLSVKPVVSGGKDWSAELEEAAKAFDDYKLQIKNLNKKIDALSTEEEVEEARKEVIARFKDHKPQKEIDLLVAEAEKNAREAVELKFKDHKPQKEIDLLIAEAEKNAREAVELKFKDHKPQKEIDLLIAEAEKNARETVELKFAKHMRPDELEHHVKEVVSKLKSPQDQIRENLVLASSQSQQYIDESADLLKDIKEKAAFEINALQSELDAVTEPLKGQDLAGLKLSLGKLKNDKLEESLGLLGIKTSEAKKTVKKKEVADDDQRLEDNLKALTEAMTKLGVTDTRNIAARIKEISEKSGPIKLKIQQIQDDADRDSQEVQKKVAIEKVRLQAFAMSSEDIGKYIDTNLGGNKSKATEVIADQENREAVIQHLLSEAGLV